MDFLFILGAQLTLQGNQAKSMDQFPKNVNSQNSPSSTINTQLHSQKSLSDEEISAHIKTIWEICKSSQHTILF